MEQENAFLKNSLSRILDSFTEEGLLHWADECQGALLQREAAMDLLRHDILNQVAEIDLVKTNPILPIYNKVALSQKHLRSKIDYVEKEFRSIKNSFIHDFERIVSF